MMKKRIVALLLAGLMTTATLASCRAQNNNNPQGTEPNQTTPSSGQQTTPAPDNPYIPPVVTWQDVDKSVYTLSDIKLRAEANATSTALADIAKVTKLHCTKQSTSWYYVEYDGKQGYVPKASVTEINITGSDFEDIAGGSKIMYANEKTINVRPYPVTNDTFAKAVATYNLNDEVTVVATNNIWYKVKFVDKNNEEHFYYVHNSCLSDTKVEDPNNADQYKHLFNDVTGTPIMYVDNASQVKFRKTPNIKSDELLTLAKGDSVTVLQTGEVDGTMWAYAVVEVAPKKPGDGVTYERGYISYHYLSYTNGNTTLDELIALYPMFTKTDVTTMYILQEAAITVRSTPSIVEGQDNSLSHPESGKTPETIKALKVLANGEIDGTSWLIVEYTKKDGEKETVIRGFVGGKALDYLTSDPNGNQTVTLNDLLLKYPEFEKLETPVTVTTKEANCYGTPDNGGKVLKTLPANTQVTLVAKEEGAFSSWSVIMDAEGALYFVNSSLLNQAQ